MLNTKGEDLNNISTLYMNIRYREILHQFHALRPTVKQNFLMCENTIIQCCWYKPCITVRGDVIIFSFDMMTQREQQNIVVRGRKVSYFLREQKCYAP